MASRGGLALFLTASCACCNGGGAVDEGVVECTTGAQCPEDWICRSDDMRCWRTAAPAPPVENERCTREDCADGSRCNIAFDAEAPICRRPCAMPSECSGPQPRCFLRVADTFLCSASCDPMATTTEASGCDEGFYCGFRRAGVETAIPFSDCIDPGAPPVPPDGACERSRECTTGWVCAAGRCVRRCIVSSPECAPGESCALQSPRERSDDDVEYGACTPM